MIALYFHIIITLCRYLIVMLYCYKLLCECNINLSEVGTAIGTIVLAITTVYLLVEAKRQLKKVKEFIEKYSKAVDDDATLSHVQASENIIVKQIEFHYKILDGIKTEGASGNDAFRIIYNNLNGMYISDPTTYEKPEEKISAAFAVIFRNYGYLIGHYYRNLYRIFKKIDETKIEGFDKNHYAKLVRAQLSEYEILLLFYNCIWVQDDYKFKKLLEKEEYGLLEGINYSKLLDRDHFKLYSETAFGIDLI